MEERKPCFGIGIVEKEGQIMARDVMLEREGRKFVISVGTPSYMVDLETHRKSLDLPVPGQAEVMVMQDVASIEDICNQLSQIPTDRLQPYLTEQIEPELP